MRIEGEKYIYEISNEYIVNWHLSLEMLILRQFSHKKKHPSAFQTLLYLQINALPTHNQIEISISCNHKSKVPHLAVKQIVKIPDFLISGTRRTYTISRCESDQLISLI